MTQASRTLGSVIITQSDISGALTSVCENAGAARREKDRRLRRRCLKSKSNPTAGFTDISTTHRNLLMLPYALSSCCSHSHTHTQAVGSNTELEMYYFTVCHYCSFIPTVLRRIYLRREGKESGSQRKVLNVYHYKALSPQHLIMQEHPKLQEKNKRC